MMLTEQRILEAAGTCGVGQNPARDECTKATADAPAKGDKASGTTDTGKGVKATGKAKDVSAKVDKQAEPNQAKAVQNKGTFDPKSNKLHESADLIPEVRGLLRRVYGIYGLSAPAFSDGAIGRALMEAAGPHRVACGPGCVCDACRELAECGGKGSGKPGPCKEPGGDAPSGTSGAASGTLGDRHRETVGKYRAAKQKATDLHGQWGVAHAAWQASKSPADLGKLNDVISANNAAQTDLMKAETGLRGTLPQVRAQKKAIARANNQGHAHLETASDHASTIPDPDPLSSGRTLPSYLRNTDMARVKAAGDGLYQYTPRPERLQRLQTMVDHAPKALASIRSADISRLDDDDKQLHHDAVAGLSGSYSGAKKALTAYGKASAIYRGKATEAREAVDVPVAECGGKGGKPGPCPEPGVSAAVPPSNLATKAKTAAVAVKTALGHAEHWAMQKGSAAFAKLPVPVQKVVRGVYKTAFATYIAGQKVAHAVATEVGGLAHADRVAKVLAAVDMVGAKAIPGVVGSLATGGIATAASFVPLGSATYLAYATVRHPVATMNAARKGIKGVVNKVKGIKQEAMESVEEPEQRAAIELLLKRFQAVQDPDWYQALLHAALDETKDLRQAVEMADAAYAELPNQPEGTPAPTLADFPSERQDESFSCGAAVCSAVARFYGVEPNTETEAVRALGSSPRDGTDPEHLIQVLQNAGLETTALSGMTLEDLEWHLGKGRPVIVAYQAWADESVPVEECGGKGGKPGPCPEPGGDAPAKGGNDSFEKERLDNLKAAKHEAVVVGRGRGAIEKAFGKIPDDAANPWATDKRIYMDQGGRSIYMRIKPDSNSIHVEFAQQGSKDVVGKALQPGTVDLMRGFQNLLVNAHDEGFGIEYGVHEKRREKLYTTAMTRAGFAKDQSDVWRPVPKSTKEGLLTGSESQDVFEALAALWATGDSVPVEEAAGTCKVGQTAKNTDCVPASGDSSGGDASAKGDKASGTTGKGMNRAPMDGKKSSPKADAESSVPPPVETGTPAEIQKSYVDDAVAMASSSHVRDRVERMEARMATHDERWSKTHAAVSNIGERSEKLSEIHQKETSKLAKMLDEDTRRTENGQLPRYTSEVYAAQGAKVDEALSKHFKYKREMNDKAWQEIKKSVDSKDMVRKVALKKEGLSEGQLKAVQDVEKKLSGVITIRLQQRLDDTVVKGIPDGERQRAYFKGGRHGGVDQGVYLPKNSNAETVAHELGHSLETNGNVHAAAQGFLYSRVGAETSKSMGAGYDSWEVGRDDDFGKAFGNSARYVGKHYKSDDTEIVSMGLEKLYSDPVHFARKDPKYFKFMLGVLDGSLS